MCVTSIFVNWSDEFNWNCRTLCMGLFVSVASNPNCDERWQTIFQKVVHICGPFKSKAGAKIFQSCYFWWRYRQFRIEKETILYDFGLFQGRSKLYLDSEFIHLCNLGASSFGASSLGFGASGPGTLEFASGLRCFLLGASGFESRGLGRKGPVHTEKGHFSLKTVSKSFKILSKSAHVQLFKAITRPKLIFLDVMLGTSGLESCGFGRLKDGWKGLCTLQKGTFL